ncbi:MAG: Twitching mobility protein [Phycisphaerae bacterium]|nr:Twitching mobility protein [Phycisphaerae bacterium]
MAEIDQAAEVIEAPFEAPTANEPMLNKWFKAVIKLKASDLHLKADFPAAVRVKGVSGGRSKGALRALTGGPLADSLLRKGLMELLNPKQKALFEDKGAIDFAYDVGPPGDADRFRVNAFLQRGKLSFAARRVTREIRRFEELYLPETLSQVCEFREGVVLLAGVTGSGKSTTIAAMIDWINEREAVHIVTLEDPIEYLFSDKQARINQREIGIDCPTFHDGLKYLMREDPDIVLVGEMRDLETFAAAIHAAETGHLVFGTIHASSSAQTISRILDLFPETERRAMRQALEFNLKAVICQKLIKSIHPKTPVVPTVEVMISNPSVRKLIREERDNELIDVIRSCYADGMVDFTENLRRLVETGYIDHATAYAASPNPNELKMALKGIRSGQSAILG